MTHLLRVSLALLALFLFCSLAAAQTGTIIICKGVSIPDGYTIIEETTSPDCSKGAYRVKKPASEASVSTQPSSTPTASIHQLYLVNKIYVGEMGKSDDAERFRMLVRENLTMKGFTVVEKKEDADAILSGIVSTQLSQGTTRARASAELRAQDGTTLWSGDFGVHLKFGLHRDSLKLRAEDLADGLRDDWKKAAKKAGVKVAD